MDSSPDHDAISLLDSLSYLIKKQESSIYRTPQIHFVFSKERLLELLQQICRSKKYTLLKSYEVQEAINVYHIGIIHPHGFTLKSQWLLRE